MKQRRTVNTRNIPVRDAPSCPNKAFSGPFALKKKQVTQVSGERGRREAPPHTGASEASQSENTLTFQLTRAETPLPVQAKRTHTAQRAGEQVQTHMATTICENPSPAPREILGNEVGPGQIRVRC